MIKKQDLNKESSLGKIMNQKTLAFIIGGGIIGYLISQTTAGAIIGAIIGLILSLWS